MITSTKNPIIQHIRKLQAKARYRRDQNQYVIEGLRLVGEAMQHGLIPNQVLYMADWLEGTEFSLGAWEQQSVELIEVSWVAMQAASDTQSPQGVLAVMPGRETVLPADPKLLLVLDGFRDPGNLGTSLRSAAAAGVDAVLLPVGGVDPYSPKVLRAGMGAHFQVPILQADWPRLQAELSGAPVYIAEAGAAQLYTAVDWREPAVLIIGGEAHGAGEQVQALNSTAVSIPMPGGSESLNAATATAVFLFEMVRQRGVT